MSSAMWETFLLLLYTCLVCADTTTNVYVQTNSGLVEGIETSIENQTVGVFLGIPYAKPPIGPLRFAKPLRVDPWSIRFEALEFGDDCYQHSHSSFPMSEDCLFLNVWTPKIKNTTLLPVFVYIHGGGFVGGNGRFRGDLFTTYTGKVVVSMNYRLNSFGFMNLYTKEAPGNMGLLDQQLALEWVKDNIKFFGGDDNRITIFGTSAGGASVGYHILSPGSRNLFRRAAMHSGSPLDNWAFDTKVSTTIKAMELVELANCNRGDVILNPKGVVKCLQNVSAPLLSRLTKSVRLIKPMTFTFVPTVDWDFISATPRELMDSGRFKKTQVIIGTEKNDGATFLPIFFPQYFEHGFPTIQNILNITRSTYPDLSNAQMAAVIIQYFGRTNPYKTLQNTVNAGYMMGDTAFLCPSLHFANRMQRFGGKAYYFQFVHRKSGSQSWIGVPHAVDIKYLLGKVLKSDIYTEQEKQLSRRMISQWSSFASSGIPSLSGYEWPQFDKEMQLYYKIYTDKPVTASKPRAYYCDFWSQLHEIVVPSVQ